MCQTLIIILKCGSLFNKYGMDKERKADTMFLVLVLNTTLGSSSQARFGAESYLQRRWKE